MGDGQPTTSFERYDDFLAADPRRTGEALELGADWRDGDGRYRVCWYEETTELTFERLSNDEGLDLEDFHRGIAGPIEVVALVEDRGALDALLGEWPNVAVGLPRTLGSLRELLGRSRDRFVADSAASHHEPEAEASGDRPPPLA